MKKVSAILLIVLFAASHASAATLTTRETDRYFFKDGKLQKYDGQFEYTYFLDPEKNTLVRTRVFDFQSKRVTPDNTSYYIQQTLDSNPTVADKHGKTPVIRAIARPDSDSLEILSIGDDRVVAVTSVGDTMIISNAEKLKVSSEAPNIPKEALRRL